MHDPATLMDFSDVLPRASQVPSLGPLKVRASSGLSADVLHPSWPSPPEPGIVESLQQACLTFRTRTRT